jgi:hypothetical protein
MLYARHLTLARIFESSSWMLMRFVLNTYVRAAAFSYGNNCTFKLVSISDAKWCRHKYMCINVCLTRGAYVSAVENGLLGARWTMVSPFRVASKLSFCTCANIIFLLFKSLGLLCWSLKISNWFPAS